MTNTTPPRYKKWLSWLPYLLIPAALYFGNVVLQTHLGEQALAKVALPQLTLQQALAKAKAENKHVLADMSAIWCPSCRKLDQEVLSKPSVQAAIEDGYIFTRIEYESDAGKAFMEQYQVQGFPTLLVLDANGDKLRQLPLTFSPEVFVSLL